MYGGEVDGVTWVIFTVKITHSLLDICLCVEWRWRGSNGGTFTCEIIIQLTELLVYVWRGRWRGSHGENVHVK